MSAKRQKLQKALCSYTSDTITYFATVKDFFERSSDWICDRETELILMTDIKERADKINLNFKHIVESKKKGTVIAEYVKSKMKVKNRHAKLEKKLASVLKETLRGLEKLSCVLDALEKLAVTSLPVFLKNRVLNLPKRINLDDVQVVIIAARQVCPLLLEFKRDANAFFLPNLQNVGVLSHQLDKYIQTTQKICQKLEKSSFSEFDPKMNRKMVVELDVGLSEVDVQRMFSHIDQLDKIRKDQDFRMVFLFQEEETCSDFISEFSERKPRMLQFLDELEDSCVQLDRMSKGAKISSVASSSVGAVGGVLSIVGLALIPVTAGVSIGLTIGGAVMGVARRVTSAVTTATEIGVNCIYQQKASKVFENFIDDVQVLQEFLEEVAKRGTNQIDVAVGVSKVFFTADAVGRDICKVVDAVSALNMLRSEDVTAGPGKVVAQEGQALGIVPRVDTDVPDIGQAALKGPLDLSESVNQSIAVNALFVGMDIFFICKDSISLAKGSKTEFSKFIRARAALWRSEIESWQKIHDSLSRGLLLLGQIKAVLERSFYPDMEAKKQRETKIKILSDEVVNKTEKVKVLNATVTNSLAVWLLVLLVFVTILLFFVCFPGKLPSQA